MRKSRGCFSALKKAIICESKHKKTETKRGGCFCFGKQQEQQSVELDSSVVVVADSCPVEDDAKLVEAENEQNRHAYSVAVVTAMAAEAAVAAARAAAEVVRLRTCKTREEIAATKIQMAFRGFLARKVVRALKGLAQLKSSNAGHSVKRQAPTPLKCLQTMVHVQSETGAQRTITMPESSHNRKNEAEKQEAFSNQGKWNDSTQSKEQIESNLHNRRAAAVRWHRALAYAHAHQKPLRNSSNQTFMDPNNPRWVWNWLDQWMAGRTWESIGSTTIYKESNPGLVSAKSSTKPARSVQSPTAQKRTGASRRQSPSSTPKSKSATTIKRTVSPKVGRVSFSADNESKSIDSRKHSFTGSSLRDDDILTTTLPAALVPGYMASTESARAKLRLPSPLRRENSVTSARKRLSFSDLTNSGNNAAVENCNS